MITTVDTTHIYVPVPSTVGGLVTISLRCASAKITILLNSATSLDEFDVYDDYNNMIGVLRGTGGILLTQNQIAVTICRKSGYASGNVIVAPMSEPWPADLQQEALALYKSLRLPEVPSRDTFRQAAVEVTRPTATFAPADMSITQLREEIEALRREVLESRFLKRQQAALQDEVDSLRADNAKLNQLRRAREASTPSAQAAVAAAAAAAAVAATLTWCVRCDGRRLVPVYNATGLTKTTPCPACTESRTTAKSTDKILVDTSVRRVEMDDGDEK